jgi:hypothetical protein
MYNPGEIAPRECGVIPQRHCEERSDEAIQLPSSRQERKLDCFASLAMTIVGIAQQSQLSSPDLIGRSSIPETSAIEPRSRGVLDPPPSRGMTTFMERDRWLVADRSILP